MSTVWGYPFLPVHQCWRPPNFTVGAGQHKGEGSLLALPTALVDSEVACVGISEHHHAPERQYRGIMSPDTGRVAVSSQVLW